MMSLSQITEWSAEAAKDAAQNKLQPYVYWDNAEVDKLDIFPFPFVGTHVPEGWRPIGKARMVDASGFGGVNEPALTTEQARNWIHGLLKNHGENEVGFAVVEQGQFQVYVQAYKEKKYK